jgi:hypothetical protein
MPEPFEWPNFSTIPHDIRALALVGRYLQDFAYLENSIDMAITAFLKLLPSQQFILSPNIPFHSKIHILTTLVNSNWRKGRDAKGYLKSINAASNASGWRNNLAHHPFRPSQTNDGVEFFVVRAQGEVVYPDMDWSIARFEAECRNLTECESKITEMTEAILEGRAKVRAAIAELSFPMTKAT